MSMRNFAGTDHLLPRSATDLTSNNLHITEQLKTKESEDGASSDGSCTMTSRLSPLLSEADVHRHSDGQHVVSSDDLISLRVAEVFLKGLLAANNQSCDRGDSASPGSERRQKEEVWKDKNNSCIAK